MRATTRAQLCPEVVAGARQSQQETAARECLSVQLIQMEDVDSANTVGHPHMDGSAGTGSAVDLADSVAAGDTVGAAGSGYDSGRTPGTGSGTKPAEM